MKAIDSMNFGEVKHAIKENGVSLQYLHRVILLREAEKLPSGYYKKLFLELSKDSKTNPVDIYCDLKRSPKNIRYGYFKQYADLFFGKKDSNEKLDPNAKATIGVFNGSVVFPNGQTNAEVLTIISETSKLIKEKYG